MKSESLQIYNAPSIPKRRSSDSMQCRGLDFSESNTDKKRMRKKHKYFKQVKEEEDVVVSAEVKGHGVEAVVASELVDTATSSQSNIEPQERKEPSLLSDPFQNEWERFYKETKELEKCQEDTMSGLKSECAKEIEELVAEIRKKYQLKFEDAQEQYRWKNKGVNQNHKNRMNKLMADAFSFNCFNMRSNWSPMQQGYPSSSMQYHQNLVRPTGATQQVAAISRPWAINGVHPTSIPRFEGDIHSSAPHFQASIPSIPSSMPTAAQNPDICPTYAGIPPPNMPQTHNIPINPMSAPGAPFGYHPQGCQQFPFMPFYPNGYYPNGYYLNGYNPQGYHQFPFMPSYPYSYYPQGQGYLPLNSSRRKGIDEANTDKCPKFILGGDVQATNKTKISEVETSNSSSDSDSSADNDAETERIQPIMQKAAKQNAKEERKPNEFAVMEDGIKEENAFMTRLKKTESRILLRDTSYMTPKQLQVHQMMCNYLKKKWGI